MPAASSTMPTAGFVHPQARDDPRSPEVTGAREDRS